MPIDALVSPLPRELTTPPVTKMCLVIRSGPSVKVGVEGLPAGRQPGCREPLHSSQRGGGARSPADRRLILPEELAAALGGKGVHMVRDRRPRGVDRPDDFDNVEPSRIMLQQAVRFEKGIGGASHPLPAHGVDGDRGTNGLRAAPRFHFDEDDSSAIDGDDVDLAVAQPAAGDDDPVTLAAQKPGSVALRPARRRRGCASARRSTA